MLWQEVVKTALLGTQRQPFKLPSVDGAEEHAALQTCMQHINDTSSHEGALLGIAAMLSLYRRAGRPLLHMPMLPYTPCTQDTQPISPHRACYYLDMLLREENHALLQEWLTYAHAAGQRVPEEYLPALLDKGVKQNTLRDAIIPVLGQRGYWLARHNHAWMYAVSQWELLYTTTTFYDKAEHRQAREAAWQTGENMFRQTLLQDARERDSAFGRSLVQSTWKADGANDRSTFIALLETGLCLDDEPFLEQALDDRSKDVRHIAAHLLAALPQSRFVQRMIVRASDMFYVKRNWQGKLQIEFVPPEKLDAAMIRDGIGDRPTHMPIGEKAWWLRQIIAAIPPSHWCVQWQAPPAELVQVATTHIWKDALLHGWAQASCRYRDTQWAEALLAPDVIKHLEESYRDMVLASLPSDNQETLVLEHIKEQKGLGSSLSQTLLSVCQHPWSASFTRAIVDYVRQYIEGKRTAAEWNIKYMLKEYALFMDASLVDDIATGWPTESKAWATWESTVEQMIETLRLRSAIRKSFQHETSTEG